MDESREREASVLDFLHLSSDETDKAKKLLEKSAVTKTFSKGTIIQHKGEYSFKAYFVRKGLLRTYTLDEKGREHVFMFGPEGWMVSDLESQANNEPAELFIDAIEDTTVDVIDQRIMGELRGDMRVEDSFRKLLKRVGVLQRRVIMLMSKTATERYEHFLETYPDIVHRVPQKMIASYLGITPEALSKLRGELARKK